MPYIIRDENGDVVSFHRDTAPDLESAEPLGVENQLEVIEFLVKHQLVDDLQVVLDSSDMALIRVLEDLIELLCRNRVITFTDLPEAAQRKFTSRRRLRAKMDGIENLIVDDEDERIF